MGAIADMFADTERKLNKLLDANEANIVKSLDKLERKLINAYQAGFPKNGRLNLPQAQKLQKQLIGIVQTDFGVLTKSINKDYDKIFNIIESGYGLLEVPFEFNIDDRTLLGALKKTASAQFKHFGAGIENKLSQLLYDNVATGEEFSELIAAMATILTNKTSATGRPLGAYARVYAHDSLMNYYQRIQNKMAEKMGIKHFLWYGDIMGSSRPKCIACAGRVFTEKEINKMDKDKWKGKAPRPTMIAVGGYHCRHHLMPVKPEWVKAEGLDVQNYYDEHPEKYSPKLRKEVEAERRKLHGGGKD